jgi:hypothetical protein
MNYAQRTFQIARHGSLAAFGFHWTEAGGVRHERQELLNPDYVAQVVKDGTDARYQLSFVAPGGPPPDTSKSPLERVNGLLLVAIAPNTDPLMLTDLFVDPSASVRQETEFTQDGTRYVRFAFERPDAPHPIKSGTVTLVPDRMWTVSEARLNWRKGDGDWANIQVQIEYADSNGIPLPVRYSEMIEAIPSPLKAEIVPEKRFYGVEREYDLRIVREFPPDHFTLARFGIPEPGSANWLRRGQLVFLLGNVFIIALAIWLLTRRRGGNLAKPDLKSDDLAT